MRDDDLAIMGFVRGAFGVRGWIKVHADTQFADSLFDYPVWWIGKENDWKPLRSRTGRCSQRTWWHSWKKSLGVNRLRRCVA